MSKLPLVGPQDLDPEQKDLWDYILKGPRGASLGGPLEFLPGPFNPWMQIPSFGKLAAEMGERLRFRSVLPGKLRELAILTTGVRWKAEFEFWAHARVARAEGLPEAVIDALRRGRRFPTKTICNASSMPLRRIWSKQAGCGPISRTNSPMRSDGRRSSSWSRWPVSTAWCRLRSTHSRSRFRTVLRQSGIAERFLRLIGGWLPRDLGKFL